MPDKSQLLLPPTALANCVFAGIVRDTRGQELGELDRFNHFPASPLVALTMVLEGDVRIVEAQTDLAVALQARPLPPYTVSGPQTQPLTSWNAGPIFAISIGFYPDAWLKLTGATAISLKGKVVSDVPAPILSAVQACEGLNDIAEIWQALCETLLPLWQTANATSGALFWPGRESISNWSSSLIAKAALSGTGTSLRSVERRLRRWAGQNQQALSFYARLEDMHRLSRSDSATSLAGLAQDAGFSDQSHMGRNVRRATGYSPARLNELIATEESFWCYRLLGERF